MKTIRAATVTIALSAVGLVNAGAQGPWQQCKIYSYAVVTPKHTSLNAR